jgi:hypothetical protein
MPTDCQRDDRRRLITITLTEPFSFDELLAQVDRQWAEDAWDYAVLYDGRANEYVRPASELERLVDHVQVVGRGRPRGPVGIIIPPRSEMIQRGIQFAARLRRPRNVEILLNQTQVDEWIARHAPHC